MSFNLQRLKKSVVSLSSSDDWDVAVREWDVVSCQIDNSKSSSCVCGQTGLKYLFTISNRITEKTLFPIGSSCIERFGVEELTNKADFIKRMLICADKSFNGEYIDIQDKDIFSRDIIDKLFYCDCFTEDEFDWDKTSNYHYLALRRAFNKGRYDKDEIHKIIYNMVVPYAQKMKRHYAPVNSFVDFSYQSSAIKYCYINDKLLRLTFPINAVRTKSLNSDKLDVMLPYDFADDAHSIKWGHFSKQFVTLPRYIEPSSVRKYKLKDNSCDCAISLVKENMFAEQTISVHVESPDSKKTRLIKTYTISEFINLLLQNGAQEEKFDEWEAEDYSI